MSAPYDREGTVAAMQLEVFPIASSDVVGEEIGPGPNVKDKDMVDWIKIIETTYTPFGMKMGRIIFGR
ncbi:MAG: hypothetical protein CM15mP62_26120 [Rhodospirillaceae bacterium]|nr:MAG: hypothetical protein CM15mP62_26120 [Rhodospirillaceae bacterium]